MEFQLPPSLAHRAIGTSFVTKCAIVHALIFPLPVQPIPNPSLLSAPDQSQLVSTSSREHPNKLITSLKTPLETEWLLMLNCWRKAGKYLVIYGGQPVISCIIFLQHPIGPGSQSLAREIALSDWWCHIHGAELQSSTTWMRWKGPIWKNIDIIPISSSESASPVTYQKTEQMVCFN